MKPLKESINAFYEDQHLSRSQLKQLRRLQQRPSRTPWLISLVGVAAVVILSLGVFVGQQKRDRQRLMLRIADEVAMNHRKNLALEVQASSLNVIQRQLNRLDFQIVVPVPPLRATLLGGRYCSIQGQLAAQLRYQDDRGAGVTVYQAPLDVTWTGLPQSPKTLVVDGVGVSLWRQGDLIIARATQAP